MRLVFWRGPDKLSPSKWLSNPSPCSTPRSCASRCGRFTCRSTWLRVEYGIEKPSNKLHTLAELDSNTWVSEVKRIRGSVGGRMKEEG